MLLRSRFLIATLLAVGLLSSCNQPAPSDLSTAPDTPTPETSLPSETSSPAPIPPFSKPAPLEVNSFTLDDVLEQAGSGCSVLLRRSPEDTDYIFHERIQADGYGPALMKIEGDWVTFLPTTPAADTYAQTRTFESENGDFSLTADTALGERTGYEVAEIPNATLEVQYQSEPATTVLAVGESGC